MLTSDLARNLTIPCQIHFVQASSYGSEKVSSGQVQLANTLDVAGQHVVLIEDIYDTGNTLERVLRDLRQQNPASLEVCALLDKLLPELQRQGRRVLIFSQMTRMLDILQDYCAWRGFKHERIDGSVHGAARQAALLAFGADPETAAPPEA